MSVVRSTIAIQVIGWKVLHHLETTGQVGCQEQFEVKHPCPEMNRNAAAGVTVHFRAYLNIILVATQIGKENEIICGLNSTL